MDQFLEVVQSIRQNIWDKKLCAIYTDALMSSSSQFYFLTSYVSYDPWTLMSILSVLFHIQAILSLVYISWSNMANVLNVLFVHNSNPCSLACNCIIVNVNHNIDHMYCPAFIINMFHSLTLSLLVQSRSSYCVCRAFIISLR